MSSIQYVVVMRPGAPVAVEAHADSLEALQALVGGYIERLPESIVRHPHDAYVNEEGLMLGLPENRGYVGTIVVTGPEGSPWHYDQALARAGELELAGF